MVIAYRRGVDSSSLSFGAVLELITIGALHWMLSQVESSLSGLIHKIKLPAEAILENTDDDETQKD